MISNRFKVISNHSKTIKSNYIKIISDHFSVISDHFKKKKCTLDQPNKNGPTMKLFHLRISGY